VAEPKQELRSKKTDGDHSVGSWPSHKSRRIHGWRRNCNVDQAGQVVLVLQRGGALGAYQAGIKGSAKPASNRIGSSAHRSALSTAHLSRKMSLSPIGQVKSGSGLNRLGHPRRTMVCGRVDRRRRQSKHPAFFRPNPDVAWGMHAPISNDRAAFYNVVPLKVTYIFRQKRSIGYDLPAACFPGESQDWRHGGLRVQHQHASRQPACTSAR
jgi:hypothetical protein